MISVNRPIAVIVSEFIDHIFNYSEQTLKKTLDFYIKTRFKRRVHMKVLLGFTCGGVQRYVTGGEPLVGQTLVRNKDNGQEVGGGGSGRRHVRATEPTTQC